MMGVLTRSLALLLWLALPQATSAGTTDEMISGLFAKHGASGAFVLLDASTGKLTVYNEERAARPMPPASTFKIANSLIALDTGVVADENEIFPYDGKPRPLASWEKDMSLRDAIKVSNLPVYQEIARRIGLTRYHKWLARLDYGNGKTGKNVERFWVDGPLEITAIEQVQFLEALALRRLDATDRSQRIVRDIMRRGRRGEAVLYGKTGWTMALKPGIGWFVGWVENNGRVYSFALNIDMASASHAKNRIDLTVDLLRELGVY